MINLREWLAATEADRDRIAKEYQVLQNQYGLLLAEHQSTQEELKVARNKIAKLKASQLQTSRS